jgi:hypothetical protein
MVVVLSGGIGRNVAFSAMIPKLAEKYGDFNIMSPWPDLFVDIPGVKRSMGLGAEYGYDDYFKGQDRLVPEPYNNNAFFKKEIGLIEAFAQELDLEYDEEKDVPLIPLSPVFKNQIDALKKNGKYIVVQFMGGNQAQNGKPNENKIMVKDYPPQLIENLILAIKEMYPDYQIVNYGLNFEFNIAGTVSVADLPYIAAPYLLAQAESFIAIDSNLQHFSVCKDVAKKGIVLWGATSPLSFGYKQNINLTGECPLKDLHCTRPYFQFSSDVVAKGLPWVCKKPECINISIDLIMDELARILN